MGHISGWSDDSLFRLGLSVAVALGNAAKGEEDEVDFEAGDRWVRIVCQPHLPGIAVVEVPTPPAFTNKAKVG